MEDQGIFDRIHSKLRSFRIMTSRIRTQSLQLKNENRTTKENGANLHHQSTFS